MSGAFVCVCVCSASGPETMIDSLTSLSDVSVGDLRRHGESSRCSGDGRLSRTERLEIISFVAAAGMSECSAWIVPMRAQRPERRSDNGETEMLSNSYHYVNPSNEAERAYLESLIREDFERCHPGEALEDVKRRASFSKEDKGLLRDWMAVAAMRATTDRAMMPPALAA